MSNFLSNFLLFFGNRIGYSPHSHPACAIQLVYIAGMDKLIFVLLNVAVLGAAIYAVINLVVFLFSH